MSVARDPDGNECCLLVDASGALIMAGGAAASSQAADQPIGAMQQSLFPPGEGWIPVNGQTVDPNQYPEFAAKMREAHITRLPDMSYMWVKAK